MTRFLIRTFIKNHDQPKNPHIRSHYGTLAGWVGILCNLFLFAGKFFTGYFCKSVSISADAFNNLSDASSSIVSLIGFKMGSRPADAEHPYGHARYEYLAGLTVSVMILVIGVELFRDGVVKILHPSPVSFSMLSVVVLAVSILLKLWMASFNRTVGDIIDSRALRATAADSRGDVVATLAVLISSLFSHFAGIELDGFMGVLVALFILYNGFCLVKETLDPLLGQAPDPELVGNIKQKILSYPDVIGAHDLMVHDYGPGRQFASVHVEMAAERDALSSHEVIDRIERDFLENENIHLIIHYDPIVTSDAALSDLRGWLSEHIRSVYPALSIHDLRVERMSDHTNVIFDCLMPDDCPLCEETLREAVQAMVSRTYPNYRCIITVDRGFAAIPKSPDTDEEHS